MRFRGFPAVALALAVAVVPCASAALTWETTRVEAKAAPGQERFEAVFAFKNTGTQPVTITSTESSCGCTTARLVKAAYAPDESGTIRMLFEFGDRVGPQQKVVTVKTDDGANATHLVMRIDIPELLALELSTLQWVVGAAPEAQSVTLRAAPGVTIGKLEFDPTALSAEVAPLDGADGFRVTVKPLTTAKAFRQVVRLHAECAGKPRVVPLYVSVR